MSEWKSYRRVIISCLNHLLARLLSKKQSESADSTTESAKDAESADSATEGPENVETAQFVSKEFSRLTQELDVEDGSGQPVVLILDDNMFYASMRYEIYQLARTCE